MNSQEAFDKDKQETFNKVATHLMTQNEKAQDRYGCLYRTEDGKTCAVGCLIPKDIYDERMEHTDLDSILKNFPELTNIIQPQLDLLTALQKIHDNVDVELWPNHLVDLATLEDLEVPAILKK